MNNTRSNNIIRLLLQYKRPEMARVSISSCCQLRCPECSTASGENRHGVIGFGNMKARDFSMLLDTAPFVRVVEIAHLGEIFLNKELPVILQEAFERRVAVTVGVGVNLNTMSDEACDALVRFQVRTMTVAIDGVTQRVYEKYRRGGCLDNVVANVKKINIRKKYYGSVYPKLVWQFIIFKHNRHQLHKAQMMADDMGMSFSKKLDWSEGADVFPGEISFPTRDSFLKKTGRLYILPCRQLWNSPQINWDGALLGCCDNRFASLGNTLRKGMEPCLRSSSYKRIKKIALGLIRADSKDPCFRCSFYQIPASDRLRAIFQDFSSSGILRV